jgi:TetR/AcrR family transcriptional regulator
VPETAQSSNLPLAASSAAQLGRRERNKLDKLERITAAARELFAAKGISEVTTGEVAALADVATGTLFLYAKSKGELLLLAQNAAYVSAHETGLTAAKAESDRVKAIVALLAPIVHCNREHAENGRAYLQEVVFGNGNDEHRNEALELMAGTEAAVLEILGREREPSHEKQQQLANITMSIMFLNLSSPAHLSFSADEILATIAAQVSAILS